MFLTFTLRSNADSGLNQAGLVYISPFIGGVLGTAVAGKVSDIIVRYMSRRNDGIYEVRIVGVHVSSIEPNSES